MKNVTYGHGGYDPTKPNNNIIEEVDIQEDPQPDIQVLVDELAALPPATLAALKQAIGIT